MTPANAIAALLSVIGFLLMLGGTYWAGGVLVAAAWLMVYVQPDGHTLWGWLFSLAVIGAGIQIASVQ